MRTPLASSLLASALALSACGGTSAPSTGTTTGTTGSPDSGNVASVHDAIYNVTSLSYEGEYVVIRTKDLPDHGSPFYAMTNPLYEPYDGTNASFSTSINLMGMISDPDLSEQDVTLRIPRHPVVASTHAATGFGAIGIALNGVLLYNQYNGMGAQLDTLEFNNFDQYNGHPTPSMAGAQYHYHIEPLFLTDKYGSDGLVGFLLDGFPIYGPVENGTRLTSAELDDYHGHVGVTPEYPEGIYHYHFTDDAPWLNGDGYYGTPGSVTH